MAVFRVERNTGYTVMSNHHLRNKELSLKAKGLLSQMLSLPEDWDYTLSGLSYINRESIDAIRTAVWELEKAGYITRRQGRDEKGKMTAIEYTIYEQPQPPELDCPVLENPTADNPILENPTTDNPTSENPTQLNKDIQRTNLPKKEKSNTDLSSTHSIPIHSLNSLPYGEDETAQPPERKRTERNDAYRVYEEIIKDNIAYDILLQDRSLDRDRLNEIVDLMLETVCTARKKIRIAGDDYPAELVKSKFMKLNSEHIRFVLDCMQENTTKIDGKFQFCFGGFLFLIHRIILSLAAFLRHKDGQAVFPAQPVADVAYSVIGALVGNILVVVYKVYRTKNDVVMDMPFIYVSGKDVFILPLCYRVGKLFSDFMGFLIIDFPRLKRLYQMVCEVVSSVKSLRQCKSELNICRFIAAPERGHQHFPVRLVRVLDIVKGFF